MSFKSGDLVRIKPSEAEGFLMPLRKWGREKRGGTVIYTFPNGHLLVKFDTFRKAKYPHDYQQPMSGRDLEPIPPEEVR
jgi:hypothetical protein